MSHLKFLFLALAAFIPARSLAQTPRVDFHSAQSWSARYEPAARVIVLHGWNETFARRGQSWQQAGYAIHGSAPLAWGNFMDYLTGTWNGVSHFDEIQLRRDGTEFEHESGGYYLAPSASYLEYLKKKMEFALDARAEAIRLEQPFYWSAAGYSDGFKREWENFYQSPWEAPDQSLAAQWQAEQLKFELELRAVSELLAHAKAYAQGKGQTLKGYVAALSSLQYALAGKVGPQAELLYVPECDGVIGQVEAEVRPVQYAGVSRARPFESAWFDFGLFAQAGRGHDKDLAFGFESGNAASWEEHKKVLHAQVAAALFYPECARYEFRTPVEKIFAGSNRGANNEPNDAALQVLMLEHVMEHLPQASSHLEAGERGIGILLSDAITLQRAAPEPGDSALASFYGLALPLLKHGIPVQPLVLENLSRPNYLTGYKILFLSYRGFKPGQAQWHERLATWVKTGGTLVFVDDERDAFNHAPGWWRESAHDYARPSEHLFQALGLNSGASPGRNKAGMGALIHVAENPASYALRGDGPDSVLALLEAAMPHGRKAKRQNYLKLRRGPYVIAAALDETPASSTLSLQGDWIDLLDAALPRLSQKNIPPGEVALLFDLSKRDSTKAHVLAASAHIADERREATQYTFTARGPAHLLLRAVISLPRIRAQVTATCGGIATPVQTKLAGNLMWLEFEPQEQPVEVRIAIP